MQNVSYISISRVSSYSFSSDIYSSSMIEFSTRIELWNSYLRFLFIMLSISFINTVVFLKQSSIYFSVFSSYFFIFSERSLYSINERLEATVEFMDLFGSIQFASSVEFFIYTFVSDEFWRFFQY